MKHLKQLCLLASLVLSNLTAQGQTNLIYIWANYAGLPGGPGNADGAGSAARFNNPAGVAVDSAGNVYVADSGNHTLRKITSGGSVTTLAGLAGVSGSVDGVGPAARFNQPYGVAVDSAGNVYVADTFNSAIRKVTSGGGVSTLAGIGSCGCGDGTGRAVQFCYPYSVAVDSGGNVYVTDTFNNTIRKMTSAGLVTTLAGSAGNSGCAVGVGPAARFWNPSGAAVDPFGNVFVADNANAVIRRVRSDGTAQPFVGSCGMAGCADGMGAAARFSQTLVDQRTPGASVALDSAGNVYVADTANHTLRRITTSGMVTTLTGSCGSSGSADGTNNVARFNSPSGIAVDAAGNLFVADTGNHIIRKVTLVGTNWVVTTFAGSAPSAGKADGTNTVARFNGPSGVAVESARTIYVADTTNCTIRKVTSGGVVTTVAGSPTNSGCVNGTGASARFYYPYGVAVATNGNVYVADSSNCIIRQVTSAGTVTTLAGQCGSCGSLDGTGGAAQFMQPYGVAADRNGNVYVADSLNDTLRKITNGGLVTTLAGSVDLPGTNDGPGIWASFNQPYGVAADTANSMFVADTYNHTIRKITSSGLVTLLAGQPGVSGTNDGVGSSARFKFPSAVAVDASGNVFVADTGNQTIRRVTSTGVVTTIGGTPGVIGGANGLGTSANFSAPWGIAVDNTGSLWVVDANENRVIRGQPFVPSLTTKRVGDKIVISWPSAYKGYVLQQNSNLLNAGGWSACAYPVTDNGTTKSVTIASPPAKLVFRLVGN
jgi:sugar lactone lactonase YvrE